MWEEYISSPPPPLNEMRNAVGESFIKMFCNKMKKCKVKVQNY